MGTLHHLHRSPPLRMVKREPADLDAWLNRQRNQPSLGRDLRELWADIVDFSHVLTIGICIGALGTVGFALLWSAM